MYDIKLRVIVDSISKAYVNSQRRFSKLWYYHAYATSTQETNGRSFGEVV
jgi:hypothetical protein